MNRKIESECGSSVPDLLGTLAANALTPTNATDQKIFTYVVLLPHDLQTAPTDPAGNDALVAAASTLAKAGGTTLFNAQKDATVGAKAMNQIVADLGSCLYDPPKSTSSEITAVVRQGATLAYFNSILNQRIDIKQDTDCNATTKTANNGWNYQGRALRICGKSCSDITDLLTKTALIAEEDRSNRRGCRFASRGPAPRGH